MNTKKGAGIIPFTQYDNTLYFLFHKTFKGRRAGLLVDFGGGSNDSENYQQTAIREFIEETEAMFFSDDIKIPAQDINSQYILLKNCLQHTQEQHPDWWCKRRRLKDNTFKDWKTFFVEVGYKNLTLMNIEWATDISHRFIKRRELLWISADNLVDIIENKPEKLWKRVRALDNLKSIILNISAQISSRSSHNQ